MYETKTNDAINLDRERVLAWLASEMANDGDDFSAGAAAGKIYNDLTIDGGYDSFCRDADANRGMISIIRAVADVSIDVAIRIFKMMVGGIEYRPAIDKASWDYGDDLDAAEAIAEINKAIDNYETFTGRIRDTVRLWRCYYTPDKAAYETVIDGLVTCIKLALEHAGFFCRDSRGDFAVALARANL